MTHLLAGLALGVAGSAHCAAMCGPLVLVGLLLIARGLGVAHPSHASAGVAPTAAVAEPHRAHPR